MLGLELGLVVKVRVKVRARARIRCIQTEQQFPAVISKSDIHCFRRRLGNHIHQPLVLVFDCHLGVYIMWFQVG